MSLLRVFIRIVGSQCGDRMDIIFAPRKVCFPCVVSVRWFCEPLGPVESIHRMDISFALRKVCFPCVASVRCFCDLLTTSSKLVHVVSRRWCNTMLRLP